MTYLIARLSVETGIQPSEWLAMDDRLFTAIIAYMKEKAKEANNASRNRRHR
jgi:hypothetical protein